MEYLVALSSYAKGRAQDRKNLTVFLAITFLVWAAISSISQAKAQSLFSQSGLTEFSHTVDLNVGVKSGDYQWNIAGDFYASVTPNILSELTYSQIDVLETNLNWRMEKMAGRRAGFVVALDVSYGLIQDGVAQDSDFNGDNRTGEFSRSVSQTKGSHTMHTEGHFAWALYTYSDWRFSPGIGYAYNEQAFVKTEGEQVISNGSRSPSLGPFDGLNSTYDASWYGPYITFSLGKTTQKHVFEAQTKQYFVDYYAEANWNLRSDFAHPLSFAHWADGSGSKYKLKYAYRFSENFSVGVNYVFEDWSTDRGVDTVYFRDGDKVSTQLNVASWSASSMALSLNWSL